MQYPQLYLGLKARYSQAWVAPPLLLLVVFIVKLALLRSVIVSTLDVAAKVLSAECKMLNSSIAQAAQVPQETMDLASRLVSSSLNHGIDSFMRGMTLSLTAIEELIYFALEMTVGTYACFTLSAVSIGANEAINATEFVVREANKTTQEIGKELNKGLGKLSDFINGAIGLIDSVEDFITGGDSDLHSVNLTVAKLNHLNISSNINTKLESLRSDIPTYEETTKAVKALIGKPFDMLKTEIRNSNISVTLKFRDSSANTTVSNVCNSAEIAKAFKEVRNTASDLVIAFCVICGFAILGGIAWNMWKTRSHWNRLLAAAGDPISQGPLDPFASSEEMQGVEMQGAAMYGAGMQGAGMQGAGMQGAGMHGAGMHGAGMQGASTYGAGMQDAMQGSEMQRAERQRAAAQMHSNLARITAQLETSWLERTFQSHIPQKYWWTLHYCTSVPIVTFLEIGLAGLVISTLEIIIVKAFKHGTRFLIELERQIAAGFTGDAQLLYGQWSNQTNSEISLVESQINTRLLGVIHNGSRGINQTISTFVDGVNKDINSAFQGTMLLSPLQAVANCLFENKARKVEEGLTWVYDNSQIALPRVSPDIFAATNSTRVADSKPVQQARFIVQAAAASLDHEVKVQYLCSGLFILVWVVFTICAYMVSTQTPGSSLPVPPLPKPPKFNGLKRDKRPIPLHDVDISNPIIVKSPIERISDRVTQFFAGPAHRGSLRDVGPAHRASILRAETPRTPLRAMIF